MPARKTKPNGRQPKSNPRGLFDLGSWQTSHLAILIVLTLIGGYLRLEPAISDTVLFSYDQGLDISLVRGLVVDRKLSLIGRHTGLEGVFMGPLWTWILAIPYLLSGGNPTANQVFFSLLGLGAIWFSYALVRKLVSETAALITALYVALSGPFIAAAHIVLSPYPLTILMLPYLWFLWEIVSQRNERFWPWLGLGAGLFFQFEIGFAIFSLVSTGLILLVMRSDRPLLGKWRLLGILMFAATFLPQLLFEFRHGFLMTKAIGKFFSGEATSLGSEGLPFLGRFFLRLGTLREDMFWALQLQRPSGLAIVLAVAPALAGWLLLARSRAAKLRRMAFLIILYLSGIYLGFTVYPGPVWVWYRTGLPILFVLLISLGWTKLLEERRSLGWLAFLTFLLIAGLGLDIGSMLRPPQSREAGDVSSLGNQKRSLDTIFADAQGKPFSLYVYTPPIYPYVWDHLLVWYATPKYHQEPVHYGYQVAEPPSEPFYLLIEPDEQSARIEGWKGNFAGSGIPVRSWQGAGGIRIERWQPVERQ